jgi:hypothetical protein
MPNLLAYVALALWPVVGAVLFNRLPVGRALLASILIAYLFLPPSPAMFNFPLLPAFTKETIASVVAFLTCLVLYRDRMDLMPRSSVARVLMAMFLFGPLFTIMTNSEPIYFGSFGLPGLTLKECLGTFAQQAILLMPFILAYNFLRTADDLRDLMLAFLIGGLVYSIPMLLEVRLSPQLNVWIYGFFQHDFIQAMRNGGFRPFVFLYHGLWVALFAMMSVVASVALLRGDPGLRLITYALCAVYLFIVLVLCKSAASLLYALFAVPLVLLFGQRIQVRVAVVLATVALAYPAAKGLDLVPQERILDLAASYEQDRSASLAYRFHNETILLERASEKPLFGWGLWGRNHVLSTQNGEIMTVTDGRWIISIGMFGWLGFLAEFGLLTLPVFAIWLKGRSPDKPLSPFIGPACLILGLNVLDLIPNATLTPLTWLFAGAIMGYAESLETATEIRRAPVFRTVI